MALSGQTLVQITRVNTLVFCWEAVQDGLRGESTVRWRMLHRASTGGRIQSTDGFGWEVVLDGAVFSGHTAIAVEENSESLLASGELTLVHDRNGERHFGYSFTQEVLPGGHRSPVLERTLENGIWTLGAPGNPLLQNTSAWNTLSWSQVQGRITRVEKSVRGLKAQTADGAGRLTELELSAQGLDMRVEELRAEARTHGEASAVTAVRSQLTQRADSLEFTVTQVRSGLEDKAEAAALERVSEHFRFDGEGLTITNSGTGMGIGVSEKRVIFTGGADPTTAIYPNAMKTTGLTVEKTLVLGQYALIPRSNGNLSLRYVGL